MKYGKYKHCVKSVRIRSYSGPHFPAFGLNTERYSISHAECGKIRTKITPNTDTFYAVKVMHSGGTSGYFTKDDFDSVQVILL